MFARTLEIYPVPDIDDVKKNDALPPINKTTPLINDASSSIDDMPLHAICILMAPLNSITEYGLAPLSGDAWFSSLQHRAVLIKDIVYELIVNDESNGGKQSKVRDGPLREWVVDRKIRKNNPLLKPIGSTALSREELKQLGMFLSDKHPRTES